jgi:hypothetical protein
MENIPEKITRDQLLFKEFITAVVVVLMILWTALLFQAPLSTPGTEGVYAGSRVQAPWIFLAVQTLLLYLPPLWAGLILPSGVLFLLALFPLASRFGFGPRSTVFVFGILILLVAALTGWGLWFGPVGNK